MATQKPILSETVQDALGNVKSLAVTIREKDGSALVGTLYDATGAVVLNPVASNNLGLLEVFSNRPRRVQIRPAGATAWTTVSFDPDPESMPLNLDDFAGGLPINTGVTSAVDALRAAISVAQVTGQPIRLGIGTYLIEQQIVVPSRVSIEGTGRSTSFKRGDATTGIPLFYFPPSTVGARLANFAVDGNYINNSADLTGNYAGEMYIYGSECIVEDVVVTEFNAFGFVIAGVRNKFFRCRAEGVAITNPGIVYAPTLTSGPTVQHYNWASIHGYFVAGTSYCDGLYMEDCSVAGTRATGYYVGGSNGYLVRPRIENCHREWWPSDGTGVYPGSSGGGQLAFPITANLAGTPSVIPPTNFVVESPIVGSSGGPNSGGIEIGAADSMTINNPYVTSPVQFGLSIFGDSKDVKIFGGRIANTQTGLGINGATNLLIDGTDFQTCTTVAVQVDGTNDYLTLVNLGMYANTLNSLFNTTPDHLESHGHRIRSGAALPIRFEGVPTTTGTGSLGALPIARTPSFAKCSGALTLGTVNDGTANIAGCSLSLEPGLWVVLAQFDFINAGGDLNQQFQGLLVTSGGTATISTTSIPRFTPQTAGDATTITGAYVVSVTATTTAQLRAIKLGGAGTSTAGLQSTITRIYQGNP